MKLKKLKKVDSKIVIPTAAGPSEISYLIFLAAKTQRNLAAELLRPLGLYLGQEILLMQLWDQDGQRLSDFAEKLSLDASTITKMVQRLEKQGILKRSVSKDDKRSVVVNVTPEGKKLRSKVERMWSDLNKAASMNLSSEELKNLERLLRKVIAH